MVRFRIRSLLIATAIVAITICAARLAPVAIPGVWSGPRGKQVVTGWFEVEPSADVIVQRVVWWVPVALVACGAAVWVFRKISN